MLDKIKENGLCIGAIIVALLIGRFALQPKAKVITKEVTKTVEVIKEVQIQAKKVNTKIVEKKNVDGSTETTTVIAEDTNTTTQKDTDIKTEQTKSKVESTRGLALGIIALEQLGNFKSTPELGVTASLPVFGSVSLTALVTLEKRVGLGISIEF